VLISTHPSPYSAEGKERNQKGYFIGSRPFSQINKILKDMGETLINWLTISSPKLEKC